MRAPRRLMASKDGPQLIRVIIRTVDAFEIEPRDAELVDLAVERAARTQDANRIRSDASVEHQATMLQSRDEAVGHRLPILKRRRARHGQVDMHARCLDRARCV